ncbi:MAG: class I SAM-dependent methyltransferase [Candidatus Harrisonbacteria bacterium]|nr:class I SAM-dependent methyltransferase [Candidatus Harrisonbacteria bacterium]
MPQKDAWEREYRNPQLIKTGEEPRTDLKKYIKFLRKVEGVFPEDLTILDIGSGNGKHANYLASMDNTVVGLEISTTAIKLARFRAKEMGVAVDYQLADIGAPYPFDNDYFDLVIDIMSSNSLNEKEREIYLNEVFRVLKKDGHFFVRALCKDGDKNAKNLLRLNPGLEYDTYINKDMSLTERVFSHDDFINLYSKYFEIQKLIKKTNYAQFKGQSYKRNYWLAYMKPIRPTFV